MYNFLILPSAGIILDEDCGVNLSLRLTNLIHCNPGMPPYNVNVTYGNNTLTLWKNGSSSALGPKCISVRPLSCQTTDTMELSLYLNASVEGCQNSTLSTVVAKYDDAIQHQTSINVTGMLILSFGAFCVCAHELCACTYELSSNIYFLLL